MAAISSTSAWADPVDDRVVTLQTVEVCTEVDRPADRQAPPEIEDGKITAGKKATRIELDAQPAIADNNFRQLLARAPGLLLSEQPVPSHYNVNYRGLGDPHESEFVLFAVNGIPVLSDWFGYPTLYFTPPTQRIAHIDFIRGGSGLLYGPQPGPVVNLILRRPQPGAPTASRLDALAGSDGFSGAYGELSGGTERFGWLLSANQHRSDGQRRNGGDGYEVLGSSAALAFQPGPGQSWDINISAYRSATQEPGRLTLAQFNADPLQTTTPTNRIWIDRVDLSLAHQRGVGSASQLTAKLWHHYQDRDSRRAANSAPGTPLPAFTTFDRQQFHVAGFDARLLTEWGGNHSLTIGSTLYRSDSPRSQARSNNLRAAAGESLRFAQERDNSYGALFIENAFRIGDWTLVPALRQERLLMRIEEPVKLTSLSHTPIERSFGRNETLLGFGASRALGEHWRFYGNASQGYRPMRYDDIGNPTAELGGSNDPQPARAENFEIGVRGTPVRSVFVDFSLFRIDLNDKIEQRLVNMTDIERINSGDARHQGLEFAIDWNLLADSASGDTLTLFVNGSLLDAEITRSGNPALLGRTPQYAPDRVLRAGLLWRGSTGSQLALTGTYVSEMFWRDDNLGSGSGATLLPASMPGYTVWDLAAEWPLGEKLTLLGGVNNIGDRVYSSRIRSDGIEVAPRRSGHLGLRLSF